MKSNLLVVLAMTLSFASAYAQSDEQVLNSDPINVDGYLAEKQVTDGELEQIKSEIRKQKGEVQLQKEKSKGFRELTKTTEKLSETTEEYLDEKKAAQKDIAEYNAKIKCLMEENPGRDCDKYLRNRKKTEDEVQEVQTRMAAPSNVSAVEVEGPIGMSDKPFETIKAALEGGVVNYTSDNEDLRADTMGVRLESNINSRFSMSVGAGYTSFNTEDYAPNSFTGFGGAGYYGNMGYGAQGREIQYKNFAVNFAGKFYIVQTERFRPYVGAGIGYNMANLKYTNNNPYSNGMYMYGDEAFKTNFATGSLFLGTEVMITRRVGLNVQAGYATGLGDSLSSTDAKNRTTSPDQARLSQLGSEVIKARALSLTAGLLVVF